MAGFPRTRGDRPPARLCPYAPPLVLLSLAGCGPSTSTPASTNTPVPTNYRFSNGEIYTCTNIRYAYEAIYDSARGTGAAVHRARKAVGDTVGVTPAEAQAAYDSCMSVRDR